MDRETETDRRRYIYIYMSRCEVKGNLTASLKCRNIIASMLT